jgi:hypothetical protein
VAIISPDNANVFVRGESLPFLAGKEGTLNADVFVRSESLPALVIATPSGNITDSLRNVCVASQALTFDATAEFISSQATSTQTMDESIVTPNVTDDLTSSASSSQSLFVDATADTGSSSGSGSSSLVSECTADTESSSATSSQTILLDEDAELETNTATLTNKIVEATAETDTSAATGTATLSSLDVDSGSNTGTISGSLGEATGEALLLQGTASSSLLVDATADSLTSIGQNLPTLFEPIPPETMTSQGSGSQSLNEATAEADPGSSASSQTIASADADSGTSSGSGSQASSDATSESQVSQATASFSLSENIVGPTFDTLTTTNTSSQTITVIDADACKGSGSGSQSTAEVTSESASSTATTTPRPVEAEASVNTTTGVMSFTLGEGGSSIELILHTQVFTNNMLETVREPIPIIADVIVVFRPMGQFVQVNRSPGDVLSTATSAPHLESVPGIGDSVTVFKAPTEGVVV